MIIDILAQAKMHFDQYEGEMYGLKSRHQAAQFAVSFLKSFDAVHRQNIKAIDTQGVVEIVEAILEDPDSVIDAVENEATNHTPETLVDSALRYLEQTKEHRAKVKERYG